MPTGICCLATGTRPMLSRLVGQIHPCILARRCWSYADRTLLGLKTRTDSVTLTPPGQSKVSQVSDRYGKGGTCFPCFPSSKPLNQLGRRTAPKQTLAVFGEQLCTIC
jgi:hypothetical protein